MRATKRTCLNGRVISGVAKQQENYRDRMIVSPVFLSSSIIVCLCGCRNRRLVIDHLHQVCSLQDPFFWAKITNKLQLASQQLPKGFLTFSLEITSPKHIFLVHNVFCLNTISLLYTENVFCFFMFGKMLKGLLRETEQASTRWELH